MPPFELFLGHEAVGHRSGSGPLETVLSAPDLGPLSYGRQRGLAVVRKGGPSGSAGEGGAQSPVHLGSVAGPTSTERPRASRQRSPAVPEVTCPVEARPGVRVHSAMRDPFPSCRGVTCSSRCSNLPTGEVAWGVRATNLPYLHVACVGVRRWSGRRPGSTAEGRPATEAPGA
jgi:hypothetical protein